MIKIPRMFCSKCGNECQLLYFTAYRFPRQRSVRVTKFQFCPDCDIIMGKRSKNDN